MSQQVDLAASVGGQETITTVALDFGRVRIDGGIILVDSREDDAYVALDHFENNGLPYVLAVNSIEGRTRLSLEQVLELTSVEDTVPVLSIDARERGSVERAVPTSLQLLRTRAQAATGGEWSASHGSCRRPWGRLPRKDRR